MSADTRVGSGSIAAEMAVREQYAKLSKDPQNRATSFRTPPVHEDDADHFVHPRAGGPLKTQSTIGAQQTVSLFRPRRIFGGVVEVSATFPRTSISGHPVLKQPNGAEPNIFISRKTLFGRERLVDPNSRRGRRIIKRALKTA